MMNILLAIHIAGGSAALLSMVIPMVSRKGGTAHRRAGWVFVTGMAIVSVTSLMLGAERFVTNPWPGARVSAMLLSYLGVLTGGLVSAGVRVLRFKDRTTPHREPFDIALAGFVVVAGGAMGIYGLAAGQPLLVAFSLIGIFNGGNQLAYWFSSPAHPMHWWFAHLNLMLGACTAATTAFVVNNVGRLGLPDDSVLVWVAPTLIGVPAGIVWTRHYRRRFGSFTARAFATRRAAAAAVALVIGLAAVRTTAQSLGTGAPGLVFDVASIKPTTRTQVPAPQVLPSGQFEMSGTTLRDLIRVAYPTAHGQVEIVDGPDWVRNARFDVIAKPPVGARPTMTMLQSLLVERFKLKVHTETRQGTLWSLALASKQGKLGPDLQPSTCGKMPDTSDAKTAEEGLKRLMAGPTLCTPLRIGAGPSMVGEASIADLASILSNFPVVNAAVADRTGLSGVYSMRLRWRGDNNPNPEAGPLIFMALEEQLGLKLESGTGPVDVVVIDAVEQPAAN